MGIFTGIIFWGCVLGSAYLGSVSARRTLHGSELAALWGCSFVVTFCLTWMFLETSR